MENVILLAAHARAPSGFKKASIGTLPPEASLNRLASPKEAVRRPAKILRRCHSDESTATASSPTERPFFAAQRSIGCGASDMGDTISPGNQKSQPKIFPVEISTPIVPFINYDMANGTSGELSKIYLGDWLEAFQLDNGAAAKAAGCDQSYISNIVAGRKTNINVLILLRLSEAMGVTVNDFYRPLPNKSQLATLNALSPKAQAALLERFQKKA